MNPSRRSGSLRRLDKNLRIAGLRLTGIANKVNVFTNLL
jgi:hypothetical protein